MAMSFKYHTILYFILEYIDDRDIKGTTENIFNVGNLGIK